MTTHEVLDAASDDTPAHHRGNGRPIDSERTITDLVVTGYDPGRTRRALPAQRRQPVHRHERAPVLRRRHDPRRAPARRAGPSGTATATCRRRSSPTRPVDVARPGRHRRHDRVEGEHPRDRSRRPDPRARGGSLPVRARRRPGHGRPARLRRRAHRVVHGAPEDLPGDRRAARASATRCSSRTCATCACRPTVELVQTENITVGGPTMMHDFNVTRNHVIFMDLPAVFDLDAGDARRDADPLGRRLPVAARRDAAQRHRRRRALVRHRPLLRVPPDELLRGRRHDRARRRPPQPHLARLDDGLPVARSCGAGRSTPTTGKVREEQIDDRPAEFPRVADSVVGLQHRYGYMMAHPRQPGLRRPDEPVGRDPEVRPRDRRSAPRSTSVAAHPRRAGVRARRRRRPPRTTAT